MCFRAEVTPFKWQVLQNILKEGKSGRTWILIHEREDMLLGEQNCTIVSLYGEELNILGKSIKASVIYLAKLKVQLQSKLFGVLSQEFPMEIA